MHHSPAYASMYALLWLAIMYIHDTCRKKIRCGRPQHVSGRRPASTISDYFWLLTSFQDRWFVSGSIFSVGPLRGCRMVLSLQATKRVMCWQSTTHYQRRHICTDFEPHLVLSWNWYKQTEIPPHPGDPHLSRTPYRLHRLPGITHSRLQRHPRCFRFATVSLASIAGQRATPQKSRPSMIGHQGKPQTPNPNLKLASSLKIPISLWEANLNGNFIYCFVLMSNIND